ncbi:hypothetical protein MJO29_006720 [Puccinia striiformis f. sp. tritici]|uniref:hypothetical protein n=1 Tax=Puccinia striiformis f. sp. tritici TaxID=168172 RepID=UPI0020073787|nr:hypothetical protein Pst134EA_011919 [Puccinia striiformis f. sp. tritici]KAH9456671.1 hypothetical protein Pst134EB_012875 [Puccinia striiformis f. sp. tritici]KAH9468296.1 hypothetical protein Pst134EA_011919 [Puccinia striiformis f. sp. tritici]KAI7958503.1 hypothetical protein MJO29_006720 [Puccinia striiformis f. sp. tritici]KAI9631170.1 hypothetical protein KEM48_013233 [Puccinia striiformis f. sp. tritici PST-130]
MIATAFLGGEQAHNWGHKFFTSRPPPAEAAVGHLAESNLIKFILLLDKPILNLTTKSKSPATENETFVYCSYPDRPSVFLGGNKCSANPQESLGGEVERW